MNQASKAHRRAKVIVKCTRLTSRSAMTISRIVSPLPPPRNFDVVSDYVCSVYSLSFSVLVASLSEFYRWLLPDDPCSDIGHSSQPALPKTVILGKISSSITPLCARSTAMLKCVTAFVWLLGCISKLWVSGQSSNHYTVHRLPPDLVFVLANNDVSLQPHQKSWVFWSSSLGTSASLGKEQLRRILLSSCWSDKQSFLLPHASASPASPSSFDDV